MPNFAQSIVPFAGGVSDDLRPPFVVGLAEPTGVAVDANGNVYIAEYEKYRVRKLDVSTGLVRTIAGSGADRRSGDGGPATLAGLNKPTDIAVDAVGDVYISGWGYSVVRKVSATTGIITLFAGNYDAFSNPQGLGDGGPATKARLAFPAGIVFDASGNAFIADERNDRIRRVDASTGIITTVAGSSSTTCCGDGGPATAAKLNHPRSVAVDAHGNIFIADTWNHRIRRVDASTGFISTIGGTGTYGYSGDGGPATEAKFYYPRSVVLDNEGGLLVSDKFNHRIRRIDLNSGVVNSVSGAGQGFGGDGGDARLALLNQPHAIALDPDGNIVFSDSYNFRIRKIERRTGLISTIVGSGQKAFVGDGAPATQAGLFHPWSIDVDAAGNLYIADFYNDRIRKVDVSTGVMTTVAGNGKLALSGFSENTGDGGAATAASLQAPSGVTVDKAGNLYIGTITKIRRVAADTGIIQTVAGDGTSTFHGDGGPATAAGIGAGDVFVDGSGNLIIPDIYNNRIRRVSPDGIIATIAGSGPVGYAQGSFSGDGGPATQATLNCPRTVVQTASGDLLVADALNCRIRKIAAGTGIISTVATFGSCSSTPGPGSIGGMWTMILEPSGDLLILGTDDRIHRMNVATGVSTPIIGRRIGEYAGDFGPASLAGLGGARGIARDSNGSIYVSSVVGDRIRVVHPCAQTAGPGLVSPSNGAMVATTAATFRWNAPKNARSYEVRLDTETPSTRSRTLEVTTSSASFANLVPGVTYYWQVIAKGDGACPSQSSAASEVRSFRVAPSCGSPSLNGAVN